MIENGKNIFPDTGPFDQNSQRPEEEIFDAAPLVEMERADLMQRYDLFWQEQFKTGFASFTGNDLFSPNELISDRFAREATGQKTSLTLADGSLRPHQLEQKEREAVEARNTEARKLLKVSLAKFIANTFSSFPPKKQKEALAILAEKNLLDHIFIDTYKELPPVDRMALVVTLGKFNYSEHSGVHGREAWVTGRTYSKSDGWKSLEPFDAGTVAQKSPALLKQITLGFLKLVATEHRREVVDITLGHNFTDDDQSDRHYISDFATYVSRNSDQEIAQLGKELAEAIPKAQEAIDLAIAKNSKKIPPPPDTYRKWPWNDWPGAKQNLAPLPEEPMQITARWLEPAELTVPYIPELSELTKGTAGETEAFSEKALQVIEALKQSDVALALEIFLEGVLASGINDAGTMAMAKALAKDCLCNDRGAQYKKALNESLYKSVQKKNEGKALAIIDLLDYMGAVVNTVYSIDYDGRLRLPEEFEKVWNTGKAIDVYEIGKEIAQDASLPLIIQMAAQRRFRGDEDSDYFSNCFVYEDRKMRDGSFGVVDGNVRRSSDGKDEVVTKEMLLTNPESSSDQEFLWNTQLAIQLMRYDLSHKFEKLFSPLPEAEKDAQTTHAHFNYHRGDEGDIFGKQSFTEKTAFKLEKLSYRELFFFAKFIADKTSPEMEPIAQFIQRYGVNGLRVFLATEQDSEMGSNILELGAELPTKTAAKLFKKYCDIISASEQVAKYCEKNLVRGKQDAVPTLAIRHQLLQRGKKLLRSASINLRQAATKDERRSALTALRGELDQMRANILLFAATFKVATKAGPISFEDIRGVQITSSDSAEIEPAEKDEMVKIYRDNRPTYSPQLLEKTVSDFKEALAAQGKKFYFLKNDEEIIAFLRFDSLSDGSLYCASFNVRPEARGSAIGTALLSRLVEQEGATRDISLVVYSKNPVVPTYEKLGFKIEEQVPDYEGTGELFYSMKRPATEQQSRPQRLLAA